MVILKTSYFKLLTSKAESHFLSVQQQRREKQKSLSGIQLRLKKLNTELEKIPRTDDRYLKLLTEEHSIIKEEQTLSDEVNQMEVEERQQFNVLSTALRDSHEKETAQSERTKYWSIAGSLIGACIGVIGSTLNNRLRMKELKGMIASREATPLITDKLSNIESCLNQVTEHLTQPALQDTRFLNLSENNNLSDVPPANAGGTEEIIKRIDDLEREFIKTGIYGAMALTFMLICYGFS